MLRSMTGFGRKLIVGPDFTQQWEIKSVNGRHLDLKWRLPSAVRSEEQKLEKVVRNYASRGRVEISLHLEYGAECTSGPCLNQAQARAMLASLKELAEANGQEYQPSYNALLAVPSLWDEALEDQDYAESLAAGLEQALADWNESRTIEGAALGRDLKARIGLMQEWTAQIAARAPEIKEERFNAMRLRLSEILARENLELDQSRLLQELVILSDKLDVSEELTRLKNHLQRLEELLASCQDAGRRLDFTLQEAFREINTCGNKIQDAQISRLVVDFKNELEKCREQVQNLE